MKIRIPFLLSTTRWVNIILHKQENIKKATHLKNQWSCTCVHVAIYVNMMISYNIILVTWHMEPCQTKIILYQAYGRISLHRIRYYCVQISIHSNKTPFVKEILQPYLISVKRPVLNKQKWACILQRNKLFLKTFVLYQVPF